MLLLGGFDEEKTRRALFYLRHDESLRDIFDGSLQMLNYAASVIVTEMGSVSDDLDYWHRVAQSSSFEIYAMLLFDNGPVAFLSRMRELFFSDVRPTKETEVEQNLSVLRVTTDDLSCLLACVVNASAMMKRSYLVSNNRKYMYLVCNDDLSISHEQLKPLRNIAQADIERCLNLFISGFEKFNVKGANSVDEAPEIDMICTDDGKRLQLLLAKACIKLSLHGLHSKVSRMFK